jgi:ribonucleoside-diphosphate reductase alpha chain
VNDTCPERATRTRLPDERRSITHQFVIHSSESSETNGYLTVGMFEDGSPGELFLQFGKGGGTVGSLLDAWATAVSIGLQCGVPLETFTSKFAYWRFEPCGMSDNSHIRFASSVLDYVSRWLEQRFLEGQESDNG